MINKMIDQMINQDLIAGLDIGTSSVKLSVFNLQGESVYEAASNYPTYYPHPGWAEQDPNDWTKSVIGLFSRLSQEFGPAVKKIAGLGLSAHAPTIVFLNKDGESIFNKAPIWCDERSKEEANWLHQQVGALFSGLGLPNASFSAKLLWYKRHHPDLLNDASFAIGIKTYLAKWLCGALVTDPSSEPGNSETWLDVMAACGWSIDRLPPLEMPARVIGHLKSDSCSLTGLPAGLPIILGINDGGSATLSCGAFRHGDGVIELATNGVVYLVTSNRIDPELGFDSSLFCWNYLNDLWIVGGQTKCGATAYQWAAELFGDQLPMNVGDIHVAGWIEKAEQAPLGSNGLFFFPFLNGQGTPDDNPDARATFTGFNRKTSRAALYRSVIEGVSFAIADIVNFLEESNQHIERLFITGGGAQSQFSRQNIADILGLPLAHTNTKTTLGASILAAVGLGIFESIEEAVKSMVPKPTLVIPESSATRAYAPLFDQYLDFKRSLSALYKK